MLFLEINYHIFYVNYKCGKYSGYCPEGHFFSASLLPSQLPLPSIEVNADVGNYFGHLRFFLFTY
jgi:hypothetical protein